MLTQAHTVKDIVKLRYSTQWHESHARAFRGIELRKHPEPKYNDDKRKIERLEMLNQTLKLRISGIFKSIESLQIERDILRIKEAQSKAQVKESLTIIRELRQTISRLEDTTK